MVKKIVKGKQIFARKAQPATEADKQVVIDLIDTLRANREICVGMAASMGSVLLASGEKGKRFATPNSEILIHQPLIGGGGLSGQTTEIKIHADHMVKTREKLNKILSDRTGQPIEVINRDTERDNYMTAEEALKYGLIDGIMEKRK